MADQPASPRREPHDRCDRTDPHLAHRNWTSPRVGVCPGVRKPKH